MEPEPQPYNEEGVPNVMIATPPVAPHVSLGCNDLKALPSQYDFVSDSVDLSGPTAQMLLSRINESLPGAKLVACRRFANKSLWTAFVMQRELCVPHQNGGDPNVKLLFHGTKQPSLILGSGRDSNSDGFDARMGKQGAYSAPGVGAYFASHAAYPVKIHPRRVNEDGTFHLIVAEVVCGAVYDMGDAIDPTLHRPPPLRDALLHHSVKGTEKSIGVRHTGNIEHGEQYIIYNHHQAYPHFLITIDLSTLCLRRTGTGDSVEPVEYDIQFGGPLAFEQLIPRPAQDHVNAASEAWGASVTASSNLWAEHASMTPLAARQKLQNVLRLGAQHGSPRFVEGDSTFIFAENDKDSWLLVDLGAVWSLSRVGTLHNATDRWLKDIHVESGTHYEMKMDRRCSSIDRRPCLSGEKHQWGSREAKSEGEANPYFFDIPHTSSVEARYVLFTVTCGVSGLGARLGPVMCWGSRDHEGQ